MSMRKPLVRRRLIAALLLAAALLASVVAAALAAKDDLVLVTRASGAAGAAADASSLRSAISADGRFVAFDSAATNLSSEDNDPVPDIFVRDLLSAETSLVSRVSGLAGAGDNGGSSKPSISAGGRFVAFTSAGTNLSGEDDDVDADIFVRDRQANITTFVSRASGPGGAPSNENSDNASISADGRFVAFDSSGTTLSNEDNPVRNVFVRDLQTNTTTFVSRASGAAGAPANGSSLEPSISADGRFVGFASLADNLSTEDDDSVQNVFVRDLQTNTTTFVSRANGAAGAGGDEDSSEASISADGRFVAFASISDNLSGEDDDGPPSVNDIFVRDLQANTTTFVSRANGAAGTGGDDGSLSASIAADGRFVAFDSFADNLSGEDDDSVGNVFVRDLQANTTTYVSRTSGAGGTPANDISFGNSISGDGRFVAFGSNADNLSGEDNNAITNVFVRDVLGPPPVPASPPPPPVPPAPPTDATDGTGPAVDGALSRANGTVQVSRSGRFRLFCGRYSEPVTGRCGGQSARPVGAAQRRRKRTLRLGTRPFAAAAGQRATVRFRVSRANLRRLRAARKVRMRGTVVARDALGNATTARFRFILKAPKGRVR